MELLDEHIDESPQVLVHVGWHLKKFGDVEKH
jgi:hypothetical protein